MLALSLAALAVAPALAQADKKLFKPEELDQMLAPIALYPDALLAQVMMAATYPLEVVEAARWSRANPNIKGDDAVAAVKDKSWDVSVKSLAAFPSVLAQMDEHLDWTQRLGDAMLAQQQDVADSVQRLRARAAAAGNLQSTPQQKVTTTGVAESVQYVIVPTDPKIVYVPAYNPTWVYGTWAHPAYPPVYYPLVGALLRGFFWGLGFAAAGALFGGWNWGGRGNSYVNINVNRAVNIDNSFNRTRVDGDGRWQHDPEHRKGVGYRDAETRQRFAPQRPGVEQREQFRGRVADNAPPGNRGPQGAARPAPSPPQGARGGGSRPTAIGDVNRGQQVNREAARGQQQMNRAASHGGGQRPSGGQPRGGGRR